jgi:hypothetical protein
MGTSGAPLKPVVATTNHWLADGGRFLCGHESRCAKAFR